LESFLKETEERGKPDPLQLFYNNSNIEINNILDRIHNAGVDGIVIFGQPSASFGFIQKLRKNKMNKPVYGSLSLLGEDEFIDKEHKIYKNVVLISSVNWIGSKGISFNKEFLKKYDKLPGTVAAYAYDGMNLIIDAIKNTDLDREKIQKAMSKTDYEGVTGIIQFDDKGNRVNAAELIEINIGTPANNLN